MKLISSWEKEYYYFKEMMHEIGSFGNCYFSADSFRRYVLSERLYKLRMETGVCFLIDRGSKWEMCLCGVEDAGWKIPCLNKPIVANFVFNYSKADISPEEKICLSKGMKSGRTLLDFLIGRPIPEKENEYRNLLESLEKSGYRFGLLNSESFQEAYQILYSCINPFDMVEYTEMNFPKMLSNKDVFCVMDSKAGALCAVCILPSFFKGGLTAVVPERRGSGLGKALKYYSYHVAKDASKQHLWIAEDNIRNQNLMRQMGAVETGRILRQYVME